MRDVGCALDGVLMDFNEALFLSNSNLLLLLVCFTEGNKYSVKTASFVSWKNTAICGRSSWCYVRDFLVILLKASLRLLDFQHFDWLNGAVFSPNNPAPLA